MCVCSVVQRGYNNVYQRKARCIYLKMAWKPHYIFILWANFSYDCYMELNGKYTCVYNGEYTYYINHYTNRWEKILLRVWWYSLLYRSISIPIHIEDSQAILNWLYTIFIFVTNESEKHSYCRWFHSYTLWWIDVFWFSLRGSYGEYRNFI